MENHAIKNSIIINAQVSNIWEVLTNPDKIRGVKSPVN